MTERINVPGNDILGDVLDTLRLKGTIFFRSQLAAPWGILLDRDHTPRFHIALSGGFYVGDGDHDAPIQVREMEMVMFCGEDEHWIADQPGRSLRRGGEVKEACELGAPPFQSGEITNGLMCGLVRFDPNSIHPLLDALPAVLHIPKADETSQLWRLIELIDAEATRAGPSGSTVVDRLTEVLFLLMLEDFVLRDDSATGFFAALRDKRVTHALKLIHTDIACAWTVDDLSSRVGMSRATLVRRFRELVGMAPIEYLLQWRLTQAHNLISHSGESLENIAERVGYSSAQTLARAFKRQFNASPGEIRRSHLPMTA